MKGEDGTAASGRKNQLEERAKVCPHGITETKSLDGQHATLLKEIVAESAQKRVTEAQDVAEEPRFVSRSEQCSRRSSPTRFGPEAAGAVSKRSEDRSGHGAWIPRHDIVGTGRCA